MKLGPPIRISLPNGNSSGSILIKKTKTKGEQNHSEDVFAIAQCIPKKIVFV